MIEHISYFPFLLKIMFYNFLNLSGALFHNFAASWMKVDWLFAECPVRTRSPLDIALVLFESQVETCFEHLIGYESSFVDFHISTSLTCALIWFADSISRSNIMVFILILSLSLELFKSLKSLLCFFWISSIYPWLGSSLSSNANLHQYQFLHFNFEFKEDQKAQ